jgi:hypothetical protein
MKTPSLLLELPIPCPKNPYTIDWIALSARAETMLYALRKPIPNTEPGTSFE